MGNPTDINFGGQLSDSTRTAADALAIATGQGIVAPEYTLTPVELAEAKSSLDDYLRSNGVANPNTQGIWWKDTQEGYQQKTFCVSFGRAGLLMYLRTVIDGSQRWISGPAFMTGGGGNAQILPDVDYGAGTWPPGTNPTTAIFNLALSMGGMLTRVSDVEGNVIGVFVAGGFPENYLFYGYDKHSGLPKFTVDGFGDGYIARNLIVGAVGGQGARPLYVDGTGQLSAGLAPVLANTATVAELIDQLQLAGIVRAPGTGFRTTWTVAGDAAARTITWPFYNGNGAAFNCRINWGDGTSSVVTTYNSANRAHTYSADGTYTVEITGQCEGLSFYGSSDAAKIRSIISWGTADSFGGFKTLAGGFYGCSYITALPDEQIPAAGTGCDRFDYAFTGTGLTGAQRSDLFDLHTAATKFDLAFSGVDGITVVPRLRNSAGVQISSAFSGLTKIQIDPGMFYADGQRDSRFLQSNGVGRDVYFANAFYRDSFTGAGSPGTAPDLWNADFGETITLDVSPATAWETGDTITGQSSGATAEVVSRTSALVYRIKKHFGTFTAGEVVGVTGIAAKLADQGAANPTFSQTPTSAGCFGGAGNVGLTNYASIPAGWK